MAAQKWLAYGQASTRRGTPRRWQLHRLHPHPAPCPLKGRKKRFSREKRLAEAVPHINRQRGRKAHRLNAKGKADSQAAELASIAIPDEEGPEPYPGRAGAPRRRETGESRDRVPPTPENAATARTGPNFDRHALTAGLAPG